MKKIILSALLSLGMSTYSFAAQTAAPAGELTMAQVQAQLPTIKDEARRVAMLKFYNECKNRNLYSCQMAWFDLHDVGLDMIFHVKTGLESWEFSKDSKSTALYRAIAIALTHPSYRNGWDLIVRAKYSVEDLPNEAPAREGLHDDPWHFATLDIVNQHFKSVGISYEVDKGFSDPRAEWIRYLALVFAIRGDVTNTNAAMVDLKSYAKINKSDIALYNNTLYSVQKYLSTIGGSK